MNEIPPLAWLLFPLIGGLGFTVRGIAGHQTGGAIMGVASALMWSYLLQLPTDQSVELALIMAVVWALASFIGWANYPALRRFFLGFLVYGVFPAGVLYLILVLWGITFQNSSTVVMGMLFCLFSGLGAGLGFGLGTVVINHFSHVSELNSWKYALEIPTGALWSIGGLSAFWFGGSIFLSGPPFSGVFGIISFGFVFILLPCLVILNIIIFHSRNSEAATYNHGQKKPYLSPTKAKIMRLLVIMVCFITLILWWIVGDRWEPAGIWILCGLFGFLTVISQFRQFFHQKMFLRTAITDVIMMIIILWLFFL